MDEKSELIKEIERHISERMEKLLAENKEINLHYDQDLDKCHKDINYVSNYGQVQAYVDIYSLLRKHTEGK